MINNILNELAIQDDLILDLTYLVWQVDSLKSFRISNGKVSMAVIELDMYQTKIRMLSGNMMGTNNELWLDADTIQKMRDYASFMEQVLKFVSEVKLIMFKQGGI